nr:hypothetical protein [Tanacetum cinerariifolium]GEW32635.1 hypothetical protein [Tanacetum cinerariifolium]
MMHLITLSLSFWDYALATATHILNMVPTKKVDKTPYELWIPKGNNGLLFLLPICKKIVVARYTEFLEKNLLSQEISGRAEELEEIQDEDTSPSENTSEIPMKVEGFEPPQEEVVPVRRSARTYQAPDHLCLNVEVREHSLWDLNKPANYKAEILDLESDKWLDAMNAEMQSMMDTSKCGYVPMQEKLDLTKTQAASIPKEVKRMKHVPYASALGSIIYVVRCTRPNVAFTQNLTSCFQQNPSELYWTAVITILKYLRNTKNMFLVYGGHSKTKLRVDCYCDDGFETDRDDTKSQTGDVFVLNGGVVD